MLFVYKSGPARGLCFSGNMGKFNGNNTKEGGFKSLKSVIFIEIRGVEIGENTLNLMKITTIEGHL